LFQTYQNGKNIPNDHRLFQPAINETKWPYNITNGHKIYKHFFFLGPSKIYPNFDFWFENKPSGNPVQKLEKEVFLKKEKQF
jgi:hypothetical protein